ncbi:MAG: DUF805 domain-containing protein [Roseivirga sp.]|nr:DUF805 domain-containing protein [Roseivirga sp.]
MNWYLQVIRKYATFNGRATRQEYWTFTLINFLIAMGILIIESMFLGTFDEDGYGILYIIYAFVVLLPVVAVNVRRLHDIGKPGYFLLITLIPGIGGILMLIYALRESDYGSNRYGPHPKQVQEEDY